MYGLIKREIKMAGYRQSSFLRVYSLVNIPQSCANKLGQKMIYFGGKQFYFFGIHRVIPSGKDSAILATWVQDSVQLKPKLLHLAGFCSCAMSQSELVPRMDKLKQFLGSSGQVKALIGITDNVMFLGNT